MIPVGSEWRRDQKPKGGKWRCSTNTVEWFKGRPSFFRILTAVSMCVVGMAPEA